MEAQITQLAAQFPVVMMILTALGALCVIGIVVVGLTPTPKDDAKLAELKKGLFGKILAFLIAFSPIQLKSEESKKPPGA
jgi:hypothetical protein